MKLPVATAVSAAVLAFAFCQAPPVLAEATDIGAASRPYPLLDGGSTPAPDNRGQPSGEPSDGAARSGDASSEKSETGDGKAGDASSHGRHAVNHRHGRHFVAFSHPRHRMLIHRRGHRFAALNATGGA
jgi:hypothetical protein